MKTFLMWLTARLPGRIYRDCGIPFLERYFVCSAFGITVYLHRFVESDPDRGLHDHPWGWAFSLVLRGFYGEARRGGEVRVVRWFNHLRGDTFHRVLLPDRVHGRFAVHMLQPQECWTLFIHGPKTKGWGFLRPMPNGNGASWYQPHRDHDGDDAASHAWARAAPRGRDLPRAP